MPIKYATNKIRTARRLFSHKVILNGLDTNTFKYYETDDLRKSLNLEKKKIIFHATPNFNDDKKHIKGGYYVLELAKKFKDEKEIVFVVAGNVTTKIEMPDKHALNDIEKLFFANINREFNEPEQVNGFIDNSERLEEIEEELETLHNETVIENNETDTSEYEFYMNRIEELEEEKEELEREQNNNPEIFQYFIISDNGAEILQELTDEIVYYLPVIDCYVWGVTHWGTSWDYVLTDIPIEIEQ